MSSLTTIALPAGCPDVGGRFYGATYDSENYREECPTCGGVGFAVSKTDEKIFCRLCRFGWVSKTRVGGATSVPLTAGQLRAVKDTVGLRVEIMAEQTGVGSGRIWIWGETAFGNPAEAEQAAQETVDRLLHEQENREREE